MPLGKAVEVSKYKNPQISQISTDLLICEISEPKAMNTNEKQLRM